MRQMRFGDETNHNNDCFWDGSTVLYFIPVILYYGDELE